MKKDLNYANDVSIDESALDVEWLRQPTLVRLYNQEVAERKHQLARLSEELGVLKAELTRKINTNPEKYGLAKATVDTVNSTIVIQEEYQDLRNQIIESEYELEMAIGGSRAMDHKKTALENLVKLFGQNYFAGPALPRDISKEWLESEEKHQSNSRVKITQPKKSEPIEKETPMEDEEDDAPMVRRRK
jgi:hypothetical protein